GSLGSGGRRTAGGRRRRDVPEPLDAGVRSGGSPAIAAGHRLGGAERREHGDDAPDRRRFRRVDTTQRQRPYPGRRRLLDLPAPLRGGRTPRWGGSCATSAEDPPQPAPTMRWLRQRLGEPLTLADIASYVGTSPRTVNRRFRDQTGAE